MPEPAPSRHRPPLPGRGHRGVLAGLVLVWFVVRIGLGTVHRLPYWLGVLLMLATLFAEIAALGAWWSHRERRAAREVARWVATDGWEPVPPRPWPWRELVWSADTVTVLRAYTKRVDGFPVVTGELSFVDSALGAAVDRLAGYAAFAVVTLPQPAPSMAVRVHRNPRGRRAGDDEFRRRFRPVGAESHRLDNPELRAAHVRGDVPPWTLIEDELFVFVPLDRPLRPGDLEETVRRAIRVVRLLDVGADELAVEVGENG